MRHHVPTLVFVFLLATLWSLTGFAFQQPSQRIEFVPESTAWLAGHSGISPVYRTDEAPKSFRSRYGNNWSMRKSGPTGEFFRIWGEGIEVDSQVMTDEEAARKVALRFIKENSDLLPSDVTLEQLVVRTNHVFAGVRMVAFEQQIKGIPVLGTGCFVAIKYGRLVMFGCRLFPALAFDSSVFADNTHAQTIAVNYLQTHGKHLVVQGVELAIFPLIEGDSLRLQLVQQVSLGRSGEGRWTAYIDAQKGELLALRDERLFMNGTILLSHHQRNPSGDLIASPASRLRLYTPNGFRYADADGHFTTTGDTANIGLNMQGLYTTLDNLQGDNISASADDMSDGASYTWETSGEFNQVQLDAFRSFADVRQHALSLAEDLSWLTQVVTVNVNYNETCNAFFDGGFTFYKAGPSGYGYSCNNTGMIADVIYHEFGHGFHYYSSQLGTGEFNEAVSEGFADYMSASITNDNKLAPYFITTGSHLRDLEPDKRWPEDQDEDPHMSGLIVGGALWDLRQALISEYGQEQGALICDTIYAGMVRYAGNIPSVYEAALLADDDNGDLTDGSPHICEIDSAFGLHGLIEGGGGSFDIEHQPIEAVTNWGEPIPVTVGIHAIHPQCSENALGEVRLMYKLDSEDRWRMRVMTSEDGESFSTEIPPLRYGVQIRYRIEIEDLAGQSTIIRPENPGDPAYYLYVGDLQEISCDNLESAQGFTHELISGENQEGADDWQWGAPTGKGGDPLGAYSGNMVWGNDLALTDRWNGLYQSNRVNALTSPAYDLSEAGSVRLQFRRWLTVEDATYDHASIYVNDVLVWRNSADASGSVHHEDKEWILFDLDISEQAAGQSEVRIRWEIESDGGLEFGGWNIDDVCLYEMLDAPDGDIDWPDGDVDDFVPDGDLPPDGDDPADGDLVADGDELIDGDEMVDGDEPLVDGDAEVVDGDDVVVDGDDESSVDGDGEEIVSDGDEILPDGDETGTDGDLPMVLDGDELIDGDGESIETDKDTVIEDDGSGGGCRNAGNSSGWLAGLLLLGLCFRRRLSLL